MQAVLWAALGAGLVAIAVTLVVERFGGKLGGILGTLPTTIVPATFGVWAARATSGGYDDAMGAVVVGMVCDLAFLFSWRAVPPRLTGLSRGAQAAVTTAIGLGLWGAIAWVYSAWLHGPTGLLGHYDGLTVGVVALLVQVSLGLAVTWRGLPAPRARQPVTWVQIIGRGGLAAVAIGLATWIAAVGSPVLAGMVSVFPAIFMTTMVSLFLAHGEALPAGAVGPMMLGSSSVSVYALLTVLTFPALGTGAGAVVAWAGAFVFASVPAALWLRARG